MRKALVNNHLVACALIVLLTVGIYWNSLQGDFIWDDCGLIIDNASYLNDWKNLFSGFTKPFFGQTPYYRPLLTGSFIIDYRLWGLNPFGYHCTNLILHSVDALLVYLFVFVLFKHSSLALVAGLLFASHPVQTEAVAWISGRNDVLLTFFSLLTMLLHLSWHGFRGMKRVLAYSAYLVACASVLLTKESGVVLPLLLVLVDCVSPKGGRFKAASYGGVLLVTGFYALARYSILGGIGMELNGGNVAQTAVRIVGTYAYYIGMLMFPLFQNAVPSMAGVGTGDHIAVMSSCTLVALVLALTALCLRRFKELSFSILWVFVSLLPVCGIVPLVVPALEHRLYPASIGFCMVIALSVFRLHRLLTRPGRQQILLCIVPLLVTVYSAKSAVRNTIWQNERAFWLNAVSASPRSALVRNNLGIVYAGDGEHEKALGEFRTALALYDGNKQMEAAYSKSVHANIYNNLGRSYYHLLCNYLVETTQWLSSPVADEEVLGKLDAEAYELYAFSVACYRTALRIDPHRPETHNNLGDLYSLVRQNRNAEGEYTAAAKISAGEQRGQ